MDDYILSILLDKLHQKHVLPDNLEPNVTGLMTLAKLLSETDSDRFRSWSNYTCSVLNNIVDRCLKNGYTRACATDDSSSAQYCLNALISSFNSDLPDQSVLEFIKAKKAIASDPTRVIKKNDSSIRSTTLEESQRHSSAIINNAERETDSSGVCKRPALGKRFPAQIIECKKHNEARLIKNTVKPQCLNEKSDESNDLFKPSTSGLVVKSKENPVDNKSAYSNKNSESKVSNDTAVSKRYETKPVNLVHNLQCETSESDSDEDTYKPDSRVNLKRRFIPKDKNRNQSYDTVSDNTSDDALSKHREGYGRTNKRYHQHHKDKNRVDAQVSDSEDGVSSNDEVIPAKCKNIKKTKRDSRDNPDRRENPTTRNRGQGSNSKKPASRRCCSVHSDSSALSPAPKPKSRSRSSDAMLRSTRALLSDSECPHSMKNKKNDIKSKSSKLKTDVPTTTVKPKNKQQRKERPKPKGKSTKEQSSRQPSKQTANKPEVSSKADTKRNGKKVENRNEEILHKEDIECSTSSKFVQRLKQLESSILKGTPDPLEKNRANKKRAPATRSPKKKSGASQSKGTVNSKKKPPGKNTKKSPAVKTQKKPTNKKAPAKKVPAKKPQKPTNKSEDKEVIESTASREVDKLNNQGKTGTAKDNSGAVVRTCQPDSADVSAKEDKNDPESFFSSEEDSELDSEPELGTLSACMNSIKRKIPRQTGTATPPLKIFLSSMCDAQSDILESEGSSFTNVPLKLDDKNVVKRMAKANKPKETVKQDASVKKSIRTPEALKKIMKLKNQCDSESSFECSSSSDDDYCDISPFIVILINK